MSGRFSAARLAVLAVVAIASLALAGTTSADPVTGGKTKLKPDQDTFEAFADMSIAVDATGRADWTTTGAKFPITGGEVQVRNRINGLIDHGGGLEFSRDDGASVKFSKLSVTIVHDKLKVFAKSDHAAVRFLDIDPGPIAGTDSSLEMRNAKTTLAKEGAEVLSEAFDFPFRKGIPIGTLTIKAAVASQA